jgi:predicted secreted protein
MDKLEFMKSTNEKELFKMVENFKKTHSVFSAQYSTCPYTSSTGMLSGVWHCVMLEYSDNP